ncbi:MAG: TMEM175 family protein [Caulobacter sp.]|nr:TMEM175 family protein [Caulobacter sp.]
MDSEIERTIDAKRLDAFVDAAFAFAVTMLLIAGVEPISTLDGLYRALGQIPASAASFVLVVLFWLAHRDYGRITPHRDQVATLISLALVFTVLVYVFPLRMLVDSAFHWGSGRRLPGSVLIRSFDDLRALYTIYGLGFAGLSVLVAGLFGHAARRAVALRVSEADRVDAADRAWIWLMVATAGVVSALLATLGPVPAAPWLPGAAYWLIPVMIQARILLKKRRARRAVVPAD